MKEIQNSLGVLPQKTYMVPGNHDITRVGGRDEIVEKIKKQYVLNRTIPTDYKDPLNLGRQQYLSLYEQICGISKDEYHFCVPDDDLNIIHINTAILCGKDGEDDLIIDMLALRQALDGVDKSKPAIAIAHHSFDCLEDREQEQLELLLKQFNTVLFLCGHKHFTRCRNINFMKPMINLWQFICGTNMENQPHEESAEIGFFTGEIDTQTKKGHVEAHKWSKIHNDWIPNNEFSFLQNGASDGRYYFPERESVSDDYYDNDLHELVHSKYCDYIKLECSAIHLDGLPMDGEVSNKTVALEELFVPLRFLLLKTSGVLSKIRRSLDRPDKQVVSNVIPAKDAFKLVVFSGPGGGKTTWLKRLASVYGIGTRGNVNDNLPDRTLFPIWIKCRQFKEGTPLSILEIVHEIPERAGFGSDTSLRQAFFELANIHIRKGTALVLVDGLDEIGSESNRKEFISKLNRFAAMFDKANIVMTSRSVGYDLLTENLAVDFASCHIQPFESDDIERLCIGWHKIHFGDTKEVMDNALDLSNTITKNERILKLIKTPILLTTLLLVKRRVGQLPTKRAALYREAIEVLLSSWGTDARNPIDLDEALPQLAYLAHHMMFHDKPRQTIRKSELVQVLTKAREDLSQFNSETINQFISRVEDRSELLVMRGYYKENEQIEEEYEFSHLTFQEYLAAYAISERYYPGAVRNSRIGDCFEGVLVNEDMREVILLTAVLNRWGAEDIVTMLMDELSTIRNKRCEDRGSKMSYVNNLLMQIIADEASLKSNMREQIYKTCFDDTIYNGSVEGIMAVVSSKYNEELKNILTTTLDGHSQKTFIPFFKLLELRKRSNYSIFEYYFENINTSDAILETLHLLNTATWPGKDWMGNAPENMNRIKESLFVFCKNDNVEYAKSAWGTLSRLCVQDDEFLTKEVLLKYLEMFDPINLSGVRIANKCNITKDTILHLSGIELATPQKQRLEESMDEEKDTHELLGYFWFGVLCGSWDVVTVIEKAKIFQAAEGDYIKSFELQVLYKRMRSYLSILQDANVIPSENEDFVREYQNELEQKIKKNDLFDW